jgi:4-hydroxybenzoate polyprenyltransferase
LKPKALIKLVRAHQWAKNTLILAPLALAHHYDNPSAWTQALAAFVGFSLLASATYILNDWIDRKHDRTHATKRNRPLASGAVGPSVAFTLMAVLLAAGLGTLAVFASGAIAIAVLYCALTIAYSLRLKAIPVLDVLVLTAFYSLRIELGARAIDVPVSPYTFLFSLFFFLSLALAKRYSELKLSSGRSFGRGYDSADLPWISALGLSAGALSTLTLGLYVQFLPDRSLYAHVDRLLLAIPVLLYWLGRIWMRSHRGTLEDDPVLFAVKDAVSYVCLGILMLVFVSAL